MRARRYSRVALALEESNELPPRTFGVPRVDEMLPNLGTAPVRRAVSGGRAQSTATSSCRVGSPLPLERAAARACRRGNRVLSETTPSSPWNHPPTSIRKSPSSMKPRSRRSLPRFLLPPDPTIHAGSVVRILQSHESCGRCPPPPNPGIPAGCVAHSPRHMLRRGPPSPSADRSWKPHDPRRRVTERLTDARH